MNLRDLCGDTKFISDYAGFIFDTFNLQFSLEYFINNRDPSPEKFTTFCEFLIRNHVSVVRIEIGSKSVIRSVRDKRISFENQLAALGNAIL
jgi:hypothetical protein